MPVEHLPRSLAVRSNPNQLNHPAAARGAPSALAASNLPTPLGGTSNFAYYAPGISMLPPAAAAAVSGRASNIYSLNPISASATAAAVQSSSSAGGAAAMASATSASGTGALGQTLIPRGATLDFQHSSRARINLSNKDLLPDCSPPSQLVARPPTIGLRANQGHTHQSLSYQQQQTSLATTTQQQQQQQQTSVLDVEAASASGGNFPNQESFAKSAEHRQTLMKPTDIETDVEAATQKSVHSRGDGHESKGSGADKELATYQQAKKRHQKADSTEQQQQQLHQLNGDRPKCNLNATDIASKATFTSSSNCKPNVNRYLESESSNCDDCAKAANPSDTPSQKHWPCSSQRPTSSTRSATDKRSSATSNTKQQPTERAGPGAGGGQPNQVQRQSHHLYSCSGRGCSRISRMVVGGSGGAHCRRREHCTRLECCELRSGQQLEQGRSSSGSSSSRGSSQSSSSSPEPRPTTNKAARCEITNSTRLLSSGNNSITTTNNNNNNSCDGQQQNEAAELERGSKQGEDEVVNGGSCGDGAQLLRRQRERDSERQRAREKERLRQVVNVDGAGSGKDIATNNDDSWCEKGDQRGAGGGETKQASTATVGGQHYTSDLDQQITGASRQRHSRGSSKAGMGDRRRGKGGQSGLHCSGSNDNDDEVEQEHEEAANEKNDTQQRDNTEQRPQLHQEQVRQTNKSQDCSLCSLNFDRKDSSDRSTVL